MKEQKIRSIVREEILNEFEMEPATKHDAVSRFIDRYVGGVEPANAEVVDAVGDRWTIFLEEGQRFDLNVQAWRGPDLVSVRGGGGMIEITVEI